MKPDYIFIVGVAKGGTSALAGWLVKNNLATYAVDDEKEPDSYLGTPFHAPSPHGSRLPLLDASVAYFANQQVITRLPGHGARIVVCLRNPFERLWSDYRMKKMIAQQGEGYLHFLSRLHDATGMTQPEDAAAWYMARREKRIRLFPRAMAHIMTEKFDAETARLVDGTFLQRLNYELCFFNSRHLYPFQSALRSSFYYRGLRMLLEKYQPEDITVVTANSLGNAEKRNQLVERVTGCTQPTETPASTFTLDNVAFDEPSPDFSSPAFDHLRSLFAYDMRQTLDLLRSRKVATDLLDMDELQRHLACNAQSRGAA